MSWTLGGVRIYVQDKSSAGKQIIARLQPLAGITVQQIFGYEKYVEKINCIVVGETDLASLKAMTTDGVTHALIGPVTNYGNFYVSSVNEKRTKTLWQTITSVCADPVFEVEIELT